MNFYVAIAGDQVRLQEPLSCSPAPLPGASSPRRPSGTPTLPRPRLLLDAATADWIPEHLGIGPAEQTAFCTWAMEIADLGHTAATA